MADNITLVQHLNLCIKLLQIFPSKEFKHIYGFTQQVILGHKKLDVVITDEDINILTTEPDTKCVLPYSYLYDININSAAGKLSLRAYMEQYVLRYLESVILRIEKKIPLTDTRSIKLMRLESWLNPEL